MLVNADGSITTVMLSVGGFIGIDEKYVAAPLHGLTWTKRGDKTWLTPNTPKEALTYAVDYMFAKKSMRWDVKGEGLTFGTERLTVPRGGVGDRARHFCCVQRELFYRAVSQIAPQLACALLRYCRAPRPRAKKHETLRLYGGRGKT